MPILLWILGGVAVGTGATLYISDKAETVAKWVVVGGVLYGGYKIWQGSKS